MVKDPSMREVISIKLCLLGRPSSVTEQKHCQATLACPHHSPSHHTNTSLILKQKANTGFSHMTHTYGIFKMESISQVWKQLYQQGLNLHLCVHQPKAVTNSATHGCSGLNTLCTWTLFKCSHSCQNVCLKFRKSTIPKYD